METIIIQSQSKSTSKLLIELAKKLGEKVQILDKEVSEDFFNDRTILNHDDGLATDEVIDNTLKHVAIGK